MTNKRVDNRAYDQLREISLERDIYENVHGSCLIKAGNTHVICAATIEETTPPFLRNTGAGWVTAEYGMLPCSASGRIKREASSGKQSGRTQEIQRLIGRSLRSIIDLELLGERQIIIDCDVIKADGGTRTASITGGFVALYIACEKLLKQGLIRKMPITSEVAAISCGIINGHPMVDLNYSEDSTAHVDANFVITGKGQLVEVQATAERSTFSDGDFQDMLHLARKASKELIDLQKDILGIRINA